MPEKFKPNHPIRQLKSFKYAFEGLFHAILTEPNFRIQVLIASISMYLGFKFEITYSEWVDLVSVLGMLLIVELINTVIEEIMDHFSKEISTSIKVIKDLSAAAVLITSFVVLANLVLIFGPRFWL